jgi:hypothetical protein
MFTSVSAQRVWHEQAARAFPGSLSGTPRRGFSSTDTSIGRTESDPSREFYWVCDPASFGFTSGASHDPIGYRGGINLYECVGDNPTDRTDPNGHCGYSAILAPPPARTAPPPTARSDAQCCKDAKTAGEDHGSLGGGICCDGRMVLCVWMQNQSPGDPSADSEIEYCARRHEDCHRNLNDFAAPTCKCGETKRLGWRYPADWWHRSSECVCYTTEIGCLNYAEKFYCQSQACKDGIQSRINFLEQERSKMKCTLKPDYS